MLVALLALPLSLAAVMSAEESLFQQIQGLPSAIVGDENGRNPEYDRQLLGFDLNHPWLGKFQHGALNHLIDEMMSLIDLDKDGMLNTGEVTFHMLKVAKLRMVTAIKATNPESDYTTKADFRAVDRDRDFLLSESEVRELHKVKDAPQIGNLRSIFDFVQIFPDDKLSEDEFILFLYKMSEQRSSNTEQVHANLAEEGAHAVFSICDENTDGRLSFREVMNNFQHFVVPGGASVGGRRLHNGL